MTSIRIALVSSLAVAAVFAGGSAAQHATPAHATVVAASLRPAGGNELCCDE